MYPNRHANSRGINAIASRHRASTFVAAGLRTAATGPIETVCNRGSAQNAVAWRRSGSVSDIAHTAA
jgi:hypothetical protein